MKIPVAILSILPSALGVTALLCALTPAVGQEPQQVFPRFAGAGGVYPLESYPELPQARARKAVLDVTEPDSHEHVHSGLEQAARLLNLYGFADIPAPQVSVAVVVHGDATSLVLNDETYRREFGAENPNRDILRKLSAAGVKLEICGQALHEHGWSAQDVSPDVTVELSAMTALIELQLDGYALIP